MHTISGQAGVDGRVIDLIGSTWAEPRPSAAGQAAALSATLSATCGCGSEACARFDRWAISLGGCAGVRYSALYQEAREMAGPDGAAEYLEMAQRIDEEHAAGRGRWFAEAAIELANESARAAARRTEAAAAAALEHASEIQLAVRTLAEDLHLADADFGTQAAMTPVEVAAELRAAMGLASPLPAAYRAQLPDVAGLAVMIGVRS